MEEIPLIVRCERCSTLYELDEELLAPEGSEVQCARCQHVFTAHPPRAPGLTLQGVPAAEVPPPAAEPDRPEPEPEPAPAAAPAPPLSAPRYSPARGSPAVYRPPPGSAPTNAPRTPMVRRDAVGAFENRLRRSHRLRWLAPLMLAAVAVAVVAAWLALTGRIHLPAREHPPLGAEATRPAPAGAAPAQAARPAAAKATPPAKMPAPSSPTPTVVTPPAPSAPVPTVVTRPAPSAPTPTVVTRPPREAVAPAGQTERPANLPRKPEPTAATEASGGRPAREQAAGAAAATAPAPVPDRAPAEPEPQPQAAPPSRLRPAAVPAPEPEPGG